MKVQEFSKCLQESCERFFDCKVTTKIEFSGGTFSVEGLLVGNWGVKETEIPLYEVKIQFVESELRTIYVEFPFIGEALIPDDRTMSDTISLVTECLLTSKAKTIYDNL